MSGNLSKVAVLMSTFNGEKYLRTQLDSILNQVDVDLKIYIRDDKSSDSTLSILKEYSDKYDNIFWYSGTTNKGACESFFELMSQKREEEYYALADQDDIWDCDKLISAINLMKNYPNNIPLLYYSNLRIVDCNGTFLRNSHVKPMIPGAKYSYFSDVFVTGCTAVYNKKLADYAVTIKPTNFSMHDTWLYIVASMMGKCVYDFDPHISYRQHSRNVIGTRKKRISLESFKRELNNYFNWKNQPRLLCAQIIQTQFANSVSFDINEKLEEFVNYKTSLSATLRLAFDKDFDSSNFYRKLRFKIKVLLRNA